MSAKSRDRMLASIELGLGFPSKDEAVLKPPSSGHTVSWKNPQTPWKDFQKEFEALSGRFHRADHIEEAWEVVRTVLADHNIQTAVLWQHPLLEKLGIQALLQDKGVEVFAATDRADFLTGIAGAELGITAADALLDVSGTIFMTSERGRERATSLVPPVHLAIATADQRLESVRDLLPFWRRLLAEDKGPPSVMTLISGPSRTADIELRLVLGAHGPRAVHLLALGPDVVPSES
jgi:L-lactate dehydrogenase complex protein LldG